jgi:S1-C subfamily serine protease
MSESTFSTIYPTLKESVVAICSKVSTNPYFPDIVGTGTIIHQDGIVLTCDHIIRAFKRLPRRKGAPKEECPAFVYLFHLDPKGIMAIPMEIVGNVLIKSYDPGRVYYGEDIPDIGFIEVNFQNLPSIKLAKMVSLKEGHLIFTSGYPLGTDTLRAPGWIHQLGPTLQQGIIGAILPFVSSAPHAILLDLMLKGGSSGSPVFNPANGEMIGMIYAGINESLPLIKWVRKEKIFNLIKIKSIFKKIDKIFQLLYKSSTPMTLAIPCQIINQAFEAALKEFAEKNKIRRLVKKKLDEIVVDKNLWEYREPKKPSLEPCEIEKPRIYHIKNP